MNKEIFNTTLKTLNLAKDQLQTVMQNSLKTKRIPDLSERIVIDFAYKTAMLMAIKTLIRAEMERCENNDKE